MVEGATGNNWVKEKVFNGNEQLYSDVRTIGTIVSTFGAAYLYPYAVEGYNSLGNSQSTTQTGYHATNPNNVESIQQNGFRESTSGRAAVEVCM